MSVFVCPSTHKHAETGTCYVFHKCRCGQCREGRRMSEQRRRKLKAYGVVNDRYVPAQPVRDHVNRLRAAGMGWKRIAEVSGVGNTAISQLVYGRKGSNNDPRKGEVLQRVTREKAEKILAVRPTMGALKKGALVPSLGFRRRVEALMCMGWSKSKLAALIGVHPTNLNSMMRRDRIVNKHFTAMAVFYRDHWGVPAPATTHREKISVARSLGYARRHRFAPPLAWDDIDRDAEPVVVPEPVKNSIDEVVVFQAIDGERPRLTPAERREVVLRLHRQRWNDIMIAEHVGISTVTVSRIRAELGLPSTDYRRQEAA